MKPSMNRLVTPVSFRQVRPRHTSSQDPEYPVEIGALIRPRAATTVLSHGIWWKNSFDDVPLLVGEVPP